MIRLGIQNNYVVTVLRALMDKVESIKQQMGNVSREVEILKKNQKERKKREAGFL